MTRTETAQQDSLDEKRPQSMPRLRLVYTPQCTLGAVREIPLSLGDRPLGRELLDGGGIELADPRLSRLHVTLRVDPKRTVHVIDERSKNGTFLNGRRIKESTVMHDGDLLRVGDSFMILRHEPLPPIDAELPSFIGVAPALAALRTTLHRIAASGVTILLLGETGTGKEVVARAIHTLSKRSGAFVGLNCAAVPETMAESQFFGHVDGAFTGAKAQPGHMAAAHGGTFFLDEVGELPLPLQSKLLRALQERVVVPLGSVKPTSVDVRPIAATNQPLEQLTETGRFRPDLFARLSGVVLEVPSLRERREDILSLFAHMLGRLCNQYGDGARKNASDIPVKLIEALLESNWLLNVRELNNIAESFVLLGADDKLYARVRRSALGSTDTAASAQVGEDPRAEQLRALMKKHHGVIQAVADELDCSRRQIGRLLDQYHIDRDEFRG